MERREIQIAVPSIDETEWYALREPLMSGWLTQGPKVAAFESEFASRHQAKHGIATTSCTTALHLILSALGIGPGDEVIVPAFTWVATANVVVFCGAKPVFVDVDRTTFNMDMTDLPSKITLNTKAIIPVHLFGLCADTDALASIAPGIPIVEDAACAAGSVLRGRSAGSLGLAAAFSFHPRKSITTGEGGMVTTNDDALAEKLRVLRNHGASVSEEQRHRGAQPYLLPEFNLLGFNYRMTDLQGALGSVQLARLDDLLKERKYWASYYDRELAGIPWLSTPFVPEGYSHSWQAYVCFIIQELAPYSRNEIMEKLQSQGISTRPGTHAVHALGFYRDRFGCLPQDNPIAWNCERYSIALPLHNRMKADDYQYVVETIRELG